MAYALVTGCAKRIGRAIAIALARKGYDIAIHYRQSQQEARSLGAQIEALGRTSQLYAADLTADEDILNLLPRIKADKLPLELLVNNASIYESATIQETELALFERQWAANLKAPFFLIRDFARLYQTGNIINIVDAGFANNQSVYAAYALTKKALAGLTKMAALELAPAIRVNGICPGFILPPLRPEAEDPNFIETITQKVPLKRQGHVEPIQRAVEYLLDNDFVTGQLLMVDGGEHLGVIPN